MKPYFKLNLPFNQDELLAPTFKLPKTGASHINSYIPVEKDAAGNSINCATHNKWIHRFSGPAPGQEHVPILDILHPTLVNFFKNRNIDIGCIFIFYACPGSVPGGVHCDWGVNTQGKDANFAINWTVGQPGLHDMVWYKPKRSELKDGWWPVDAFRTPLSYPIPGFRRDTVDEIARYCIDAPTLVRTDIPHNSENRSTEPRWCFSIRTNLIMHRWEDYVLLFKDVISQEELSS